MTAASGNDTRHFKRDAYTWYLYLVLLIFGYKQSVLGSVMPFLRDEMVLDKVAIGLHFSIYAVGLFFSGRLVQWAQSKFPVTRIMQVSAVAMVLSIGLLMLSLPFYGTLAVACLLGLTGGAVQVCVQAEIVRHHGVNQGIALTEAFVLAGIGVFSGPLIIGLAASAGLDWRVTLAIPAVLLALVLLAFRASPKQNADPLKSTVGGAENGRLSAPVIAILGMILLGIATEWGIGFWGAQFIEAQLKVSPEVGVTLMSAFFGGTVVGRLLASRILRLLAVRQMLFAAVLLGALSVFVLWAVPNIYIAVPALVIGGMCLGNFFPLILSIANETAPGMPGKISSAATQAVGIALLIVPILLGNLGQTIGLGNAVGLLAVLPLGMIGLYVLANGLRTRATA